MRSRVTFQRALTLVALVIYALALAILLLSMVGCKGRRSSVRTVIRTDSITTETGVTPRDTLLLVPGVEVTASVPLPPRGTDLPPTTARSGRAWATVSVRDNSLTYAGGCDTASIAVTLWDRWTREHTASAESDTTVRTVERRITPRWAWYALGASVLLALWALRPVIKLMFKTL